MVLVMKPVYYMCPIYIYPTITRSSSFTVLTESAPAGQTQIQQQQRNKGKKVVQERTVVTHLLFFCYSLLPLTLRTAAPPGLQRNPFVTLFRSSKGEGVRLEITQLGTTHLGGLVKGFCLDLILLIIVRQQKTRIRENDF